MLRHPAGGYKIKDALRHLPRVAMECTVTPITRTVLRVVLVLRPDFVWRDSAHGQAMRWILWVGDTDNDFIYYNEVWTLTKKMMQACTSHSPQFLSDTNSAFRNGALIPHGSAELASGLPAVKSRVCRRRSTGSASRSQSSSPLRATITCA